MTEQQIETAVEKWFDLIDRAYMNNELAPHEYQAEVEGIRLWADKQYEELALT